MTRFIASGIALMSVLTWTLTAHAQDSSLSEEDQALIYIISCGVTLPLLTSSSTSGYATDANKENLEEEIKHYESIVKLQRYMHDEQREVWASLTLGAGRGIEDLARIYGRTLTSTQRVTLRKRRGQIRALMSEAPSFDRASTLYFTLLPIFTAKEV